MEFPKFGHGNHHSNFEEREFYKYKSKVSSHVIRKPCSDNPGGFGNLALTFPKQRSVSVTRENFETYYSVKPVFSETRLRRENCV